MPESRLTSQRSTCPEREMAKISPDSSRTNKKKVAGSCVAELTDKKNSASRATASPLTWSHRTARGLHASIYMKG